MPTICYYGDSTIWGANGGSGPSPVAVPAPARVAQITGWTVLNRGVNQASLTDWLNGNPSKGIPYSWNQEIALNTEASIIIHNSAIHDWDLSDAQYLAGWDAILAACVANGKTFVIETPNPTKQILWGGTDESDEVIAYKAHLMRQWAAMRNVRVIDQHQMILDYFAASGTDAANFTPDGGNPQDWGYIMKGNYAADKLLTWFASTTPAPSPTPAPTPTPTPAPGPSPVPNNTANLQTYGGVPGASAATLGAAFVQAFNYLSGLGGGTLRINAGTYDLGSFGSEVHMLFNYVGLSNVVIDGQGAIFRCNTLNDDMPVFFSFVNPNNVSVRGVHFTDTGYNPGVEWKGAVCISVTTNAASSGFYVNCTADSVGSFFRQLPSPNYSMSGMDINGTVTNAYYGVNANGSAGASPRSKCNLNCTNVRRGFIVYAARNWDVTITVSNNTPGALGSNGFISMAPISVGGEVLDCTVNLTYNGYCTHSKLIHIYNQGDANHNTATRRVTARVNLNNVSGNQTRVFYIDHENANVTFPTTTVREWTDVTFDGSVTGTFPSNWIMIDNPCVSSDPDTRINVGTGLSQYVDFNNLPSYFRLVTSTPAPSPTPTPTPVPSPTINLVDWYGDGLIRGLNGAFLASVALVNVPNKTVSLTSFGGGPNASASANASAFDAAIANLNSTGGGTLVFPAGTYNMGNSTSATVAKFYVANLNNIRIVGYGATLTMNTTDTSTTAFFYLTSPNNSSVEGFHFTDPGTDYTGTSANRGATCIYVPVFQACSNFKVLKCTTDNVNIFVNFDGSAPYNRLTNTVIDDCYVKNAYYGLAAHEGWGSSSTSRSYVRMTCESVRRAINGRGMSRMNVDITCVGVANQPASNAFISPHSHNDVNCADVDLVLRLKGNLSAFKTFTDSNNGAMIHLWHQDANSTPSIVINNFKIRLIFDTITGTHPPLVCFSHHDGTQYLSSTARLWQNISIDGALPTGYTGLLVRNTTSSTSAGNSVRIGSNIASFVNLGSLPNYFSSTPSTTYVSPELVAAPLTKAFNDGLPASTGTVYAYDNATAADFVNGTDGVPFSFSTHINTTTTPNVVFYMSELSSASALTSNLTALVNLAKSANKTVFIMTQVPSVPGGTLTHQQIAEAQRQVATATGVKVVDVNAYLTQIMTTNGYGIYDICPDGKNLTQQYHTSVGTWVKSEVVRLTAVTPAPTPTPTPSPSPVITGPAIRPYIVDTHLIPMATFGNMIFSDEFNGNTYNTDKWFPYMPHWMTENGKHNWEVSDSCLKIWLVGTETSNSQHRVFCTDQKFTFKYGYIECVAKLGWGPGAWPGFWTYEADHSRAPMHEEIDGFEAYPGGGPNAGWGTSQLKANNYAATIWGPNGSTGGTPVGTVKLADPDGLGSPVNDLSDVMHRYGILWEPNAITFTFDGKVVKKFTGAVLTGLHFLNLQQWLYAGFGTPLASQMNVNYATWFDSVRVWELSSGATVRGVTPPNAIDPTSQQTGNGSTPSPSPTPTPAPGTPYDFGDFRVGDTLSVAYDGSYVHYLHNGVAKRTVPVSGGKTFFLDTSFYAQGSEITHLRFATLPTGSWADIPGLGRSSAYMTGMDQLGDLAMLNQIPAGVGGAPSTYIANGAIGNAHIIGAISSTNYVPGQSGWMIDKNGTAEFNVGKFRTSVLGGAFSGYAWPVSSIARGFYLGPEGFKIGSSGGHHMHFDQTSGLLRINGTLAVNTVTADMIVSRSCTHFSQYRYNVPNGGSAPIFLDMTRPGDIAVLVTVKFSYQGAEAGSVFSASVAMEGIGLDNYTSTNQVLPVIVLSGSFQQVGLGSWQLDVSAYTNIATGPHAVSVSVFRSYR